MTDLSKRLKEQIEKAYYADHRLFFSLEDFHGDFKDFSDEELSSALYELRDIGLLKIQPADNLVYMAILQEDAI